MALNKVILIGRLVRDVEVKSFDNDNKVANFTLAVDRRFKAKGKDKPESDFIPVCVWRKSAEFAEKFFSKGMRVFVCGSLETYTYESEGRTNYSFRINADEIGFADSKKDANGSGNRQGANETSGATFDDFGSEFTNGGEFDDDLPF